MKIVDHKIPVKVRDDKEQMAAIVKWASNRSAPEAATFGGVRLSKRYKGQTVFVDPAPEPEKYASPAGARGRDDDED